MAEFGSGYASRGVYIEIYLARDIYLDIYRAVSIHVYMDAQRCRGVEGGQEVEDANNRSRNVEREAPNELRRVVGAGQHAGLRGDRRDRCHAP